MNEYISKIENLIRSCFLIVAVIGTAVICDFIGSEHRHSEK
jgi:hypothetical protein